MSESLVKEHKGFVATCPVESLKPVEALALLNRWLKLKNYFYYDDLDCLYELKDKKIVQFVEEGEMRASAIIMRESPVIREMQTELANGGRNLDWLNFFSDFSFYLSDYWLRVSGKR